ncbi:extradiol dioxygenase [Ktedonosporobacter rubrisoli]|uniref:Extradiol dioxygenase n=1 Tax=Ktedonosporobacter rubrisoli TaxID=2509675 RepID=A0A4P6JU40_KTERU|nr:VOC family protein [Ktedonosporobacter rubrisoli]QBD78974.1 extradiol dioxygenase [Ktedonosporobacter rubrisoli]
MLNGAHIILYSADAEADRAFIRDVFGFAGVDAGSGWLIFKLPPTEIAVHPTDGVGHYEFYLICDDIEKTLTKLAAQGVTISQPISDRRWGLIASIKLPSGSDLPLYQPRHPTAYDLEN